MAPDNQDRHTISDGEPKLIDPNDTEAIAQQETKNALEQFEYANEVIFDYIASNEKDFSLRSSLILQLHQHALKYIKRDAGQFRNKPVGIEKSNHQPPHYLRCTDLVLEMCDYINKNFKDMSALELSAYALWRLNWIHPFTDGNGRTARMVAHIIFSIRLGAFLGGKTIAEQIAEDKTPYYKALEQADEAYDDAQQIIDVSALTDLMRGMLQRQLLEVHGQANQVAGTIQTDKILH